MQSIKDALSVLATVLPKTGRIKVKETGRAWALIEVPMEAMDADAVNSAFSVSALNTTLLSYTGDPWQALLLARRVTEDLCGGMTLEHIMPKIDALLGDDAPVPNPLAVAIGSRVGTSAWKIPDLVCTDWLCEMPRIRTCLGCMPCDMVLLVVQYADGKCICVPITGGVHCYEDVFDGLEPVDPARSGINIARRHLPSTGFDRLVGDLLDIEPDDFSLFADQVKYCTRRYSDMILDIDHKFCVDTWISSSYSLRSTLQLVKSALGVAVGRPISYWPDGKTHAEVKAVTDHLVDVGFARHKDTALLSYLAEEEG